MDKKYGVYICEGCGIGDALDMKALCEIPEEEGVPVKTHPVLCGKDGVALLIVSSSPFEDESPSLCS